MALVACPFCRELFERGEARTCPVCGVVLEPIERLPPSYEARVALEAELAAVPPEDRRVPLWYWRRSRGPLVLVALLGLGAFFAPWIALEKPDTVTLTGFDLSRIKGGWFAGGAVGWCVLVPLVLTRRTVYQMRGVRIISATFAAMTVIEVALLLSAPPRGGRHLPVEYTWEWGLWASLSLGLLGVLLGVRLGGRLDDIDVRELVQGPAPDLSPNESTDRTLH